MPSRASLIALLTEIARELAGVRSELSELRREIRGRHPGSASEAQARKRGGTPQVEPLHDDWLKAAAYRSSRKLFD